MKFSIKIFALAIAFFSINATANAQKAERTDHQATMVKNDAIGEVTIIQLAQTPGVYTTTSLDLAPGKYIFEVTNQNVDKALGFYLTPADDAKAQVPNSGLVTLIDKGETARTGIVELTAGEYHYSCPLNPTPHYTLKVQ